MSPVILIVTGFILFIVAYITYGSFIAKKLNIDPNRNTPAHELKDGVDYVPAKAPILLGHHFASIAGAGPILGPIIASVFGWLPVFLWIVIGGIFMGGVHDMSSLIASARHKGVSIGKIIEEYLGVRGKRLFMIFAYLTMILVIAVFAKIVATTFVTVPSVATSSFLFILIAILFGLGIYRSKLPLLPSSIIGVVLLFLCINLGSQYPIVIYDKFLKTTTQTTIAELVQSGEIQKMSSPAEIYHKLDNKNLTKAADDVKRAEKKANNIWIFIILFYVTIAAVTPVWILLQPRDYLNSFLLYALLLGGGIGIFFTDASIVLPKVTRFHTNIGYLFPVLFVTVACGAISGFHSLVASGTTAKQLNKETDAKIIGYGGMLIESMLALLALLAAATMLQDRYHLLSQNKDYITLFSEGIGRFMAKIPLVGISENAGVTFTGLAVSAFALTTLDTCTRLARFTFQEFFDVSGRKKSILTTNRFIGTLLSVIFSAVFIFTGSSDTLWPIFGSANQLLASLALLAVTAWLSFLKKPNWFTKIPMYFMYVVTLTALVTLIYQNIQNKHYSLVIVGILLVVVSILLFIQAFKSFAAIRKA
ncbi:carbon starvation protein A [candidate division KSB1 bacterium]|nr:carbon starvation protein A [candidate division KSB1 bacterium]